MKLPNDIFDDKHIQIVESLRDGDSIVCLWLKMYAKAKQAEDGSLQYSAGDFNLTDSALAAIFHYNADFIGCAMLALCDYGMIKRNAKCITLLPFWKDERDRSTTEYNQWRLAVFTRDGFACRQCGIKTDIQAHHIVPWSKTKDRRDLRFDINNGITLCRPCHLKAHGGRWSE